MFFSGCVFEEEEEGSRFVGLFRILVITASGLLVHVAPADATRAAAAEGRLGGEVDVLLGVEPDQKAGHVDNLLADADVTLADEDTGVMDGLGESQLEDLGLETTLQKVLHLQAQDEIELHVFLVQDSDPDQTPEQCVTLEQTAGVLFVQGQELTGGLADVGKDQLDPPDFTLVAKAELTDQLQLLVQTSLLERTAGGRKDLGAVLLDATVNHFEGLGPLISKGTQRSSS